MEIREDDTSLGLGLGLGLDLNPDAVHGVSSRLQADAKNDREAEAEQKRLKSRIHEANIDLNATKVVHHYSAIQSQTHRIDELLRTDTVFTDLGTPYRHRRNEVLFFVVMRY